MIETCGNCIFLKEIEEWHYTNRGCTHFKLPGYACLACADEGTVIHMTGTNRDIEWCEMWRERGT